ncbi:MAG: hypothetical protein IPJ68_01260 [Candidatus Moraniibacteriota bacterium]|nr:MAG: hypothetical protein IPJ68_01260 [Candidatus Moranbacteria bacterium]
MALFIPSRRSERKPGVSLSDHSRQSSAANNPKGWNRLHLREALDRLARGDLGRLDETQLSRIREIVERSAGADGDLSAAQTREAIHAIEMNRVSLGLDQGMMESLATFLADGPGNS